jgi:manganese-dependent inorganic pyrophosphatase
MKIYITGHKNPDLDSICSAYAYAVLKNMTDKENEYVAVRPGHLSDSVKAILSSLDITPPPYLANVYPKVSDVMLTPSEKLETSQPLTALAKTYKDSTPSVVPIYENGRYKGLLSVDDITLYFMHKLGEDGQISEIPTLGELLRENEEPVQETDMLEEAKLSLSNSKKRGLAVFSGDEFSGYVSRRCFLTHPAYKVIMVDHNEARQSISGIESADVVEIVDHHRLDASKTNLPIFIDTEPLGSTCTIVYRMFLRNNMVPDRYTAKVLLTGLISDTLILKSPTTTPTDIETAQALAKICEVEVESFGTGMFSHVESLGKRDPERTILSDFKKYAEKGVMIGIGQCEVTTLHDLDEYKAEYLEKLTQVREKNGLTWAVLMITNVLKEHSVLLTTGYKAEKLLPYKQIEDRVYDMPNVMSRKKQLLPEMLYAISALTTGR